MVKLDRSGLNAKLYREWLAKWMKDRTAKMVRPEDLVYSEIPAVGNISKQELCDNFSVKYGVDRTETVPIVTECLSALKEKHLVNNSVRGFWCRI